MKQSNFIQKHEYPGGNSELRKFINLHLRYPKEALINRIEGVVYLSYFINQKAKIIDIKVLKSLGYGCDEEAARLVSLLKYPTPKNRGVKLQTKKRLKIAFKLPAIPHLQISYNYISKNNRNKYN